MTKRNEWPCPHCGATEGWMVRMAPTARVASWWLLDSWGQPQHSHGTHHHPSISTHVFWACRACGEVVS